MKIRKARSSDGKVISELLYRSFYNTFKTAANEIPLTAYLESLNSGAIIKMMDRSDTDFYVAELENKVSGFIQLVKETPYPDSAPTFLKVERLYVDTDILNQGIGSKLMDKAFELGKEQGSTMIWLLVLRSNTAGVKFYEKLGFKTFDTSPGKFKEDAELDLWMVKSLA